MIWIISIILWVLSGAASFIFWWTADYDLTTEQIPMIIVLGFVGPLGWIIGWYIHGSHTEREPMILKHKRKRR